MIVMFTKLPFSWQLSLHPPPFQVRATAETAAGQNFP